MRGFVPDPSSKYDENRRIVCICRYRPLSVVMRFDSYYPWPVNLLHHFVIHVNPSQTPFCISHSECPYVLPPELVDVIPSAVRLFGRSVLALGPHGTLAWTDSEALNGTEGSNQEGAFATNGTGERVAARRLRLPPPPLSSQVSSSFTHRQQQGTSSALHAEPPTMVPVGSDGSAGQKKRSSIFATREEEGWTSLALSEGKGRIVVGDKNGFMEVWDQF